MRVNASTVTSVPNFVAVTDDQRRYEFRDGVCYTKDISGVVLEPFTVLTVTPVNRWVEETRKYDMLKFAVSQLPVVGELLYLSGSDEWVVTRRVVSVEVI
jgi:hypothetical protein